MTAETVLSTTFGYRDFKPMQRAVIDRVLARQETLVVMPTGGGKSLCYQIPALLFDGLTVVVSPLIALMKDQVEQLHQRGVPAVFLNSSLERSAYQRTMEIVRSGAVKLLYVAPETLLMDHVLDLVGSRGPSLIAIDEAHCISEWGHDFRTEYRQLAPLRNRFPGATVMALTATATPRVRDDIRTSLGFSEKSEFVASFDRENLFIEVIPKRDAYSQAVAFLERFPKESGIVYCFSRKQVDELALFLVGKGLSALPYHAGLDDVVRRENQERFVRDDVAIIVATIAFGMGINKPNVRFVLHFDLPKSIEGYYQEIGRAGRDGLPAHCLLLYSDADVSKLRYFIDQKPPEDRKHALRHLEAMMRYADQEIGCRRKPLLAYFGERFHLETCGSCDNCLADARERVDITIPAQKFLSCVKRVGERFGAGHVVDVLLGSKSQKVVKFRHDQISTYGIGVELARDQWLHIGRQMVERGFLEREETYQTLSLTPLGYRVLKTRASISGVLRPKNERRASRQAPAALPGPVHDEELFDLLRALRKQVADRVGVPAYVVFSDRSLQEMATYFPQTDSRFREIYGVGAFKFENYGAEFLGVIKEFCAARGRAAREIPDQASVGEARRYQLVGDAFNAGMSVAQLAEHFRIKTETVCDHLTRYLESGRQLARAEEFLEHSRLSPEEQSRVLSLFGSLGPARLRPIFDALEGRIDFDELKILRLHFQTLHG